MGQRSRQNSDSHRSYRGSIIDLTASGNKRPPSILYGTIGDENIQGAIGWPVTAAALDNTPDLSEEADDRQLSQPKKHWRDPSLWYILPSVFLFSAAFNLSGPCVYFALLDIHDQDQGLAGQTSGNLTAIYTAFTLISGPIWAVLSNRLGRKIVILISIISAGVDCGILYWKTPLPLLYGLKVICGSTFAFFTVASAYVSDVTTAKNRAFGFSLIWVCYSVGNIGLPILAGWLMNNVSIGMGFVVGCGIHTLNFFWVLLFLPDVKIKNPRKFSWKEVTPWWPFRILVGRWYVIQLLVLFYLVSFAAVGLGISGLSAWEYHLWNWEKFKIGVVSSILATLMLVQAPINRFVIPKLNKWVVIVGGILCYFGAASVLVAISHLHFEHQREAWFLLISTALFAVAGSILPAIQGMISAEFGEDEQGEIAGVAMAVRSLAYTVVSPINGYIWKVFIDVNSSPNWGLYVPSIVYVASGMVSIINFVYCVFIYIWYHIFDRPMSTINNTDNYNPIAYGTMNEETQDYEK